MVSRTERIPPTAYSKLIEDLRSEALATTRIGVTKAEEDNGQNDEEQIHVDIPQSVATAPSTMSF